MYYENSTKHMLLKKISSFLLYVTFILVPTAVSAQWSTTGNGADGYSNAASGGLPNQTIYNIISNTLSWLLAVFGFIAIVGFVISGIQYLTAAGNDSQIETAKTNMKYSIVGVIVGLMGFVLVRAIDSWLSGGNAF